MARKMTEWPSKRGPISKIRPSDGCGRETVPLVVERWYNFPEFGCHLGNVGYIWGMSVKCIIAALSEQIGLSRGVGIRGHPGMQNPLLSLP